MRCWASQREQEAAAARATERLKPLIKTSFRKDGPGLAPGLFVSTPGSDAKKDCTNKQDQILFACRRSFGAGQQCNLRYRTRHITAFSPVHFG